MKPVNLIPPEERRGTGAPTRTGRAPQILLGVLAGLVVLVAAITTMNGSISDKEAEIAALEVDKQNAQAQAEALAPFAQFAAARDLRNVTVESLARSRFDWNRVLDELSRIIPDDIWLTALAGTVSSGVEVEGGPSISIRGQVNGPALELVGCGRTHEAVAGFLAALRDIDGVTRVIAPSAERPEASGGGEGAHPAIPGSSGTGSDDCATKDQVSKFEMVAAFDSVAVPGAEGSAAPAPATPPPAEPSTTAEPVSTGSGS